MSLANVAIAIENAGLGTRGTDLFVAFEATAAGITLRQSGGLTDPDIPGIRRHTFQAVVRGTSYPDTLDLAERVSAALTIRQQAVGTALFYEVNPRHEPIPFGRDEGGVHTFITNFDAVWRSIS